MTIHPLADPAIREKIMSDPVQILDDVDLMRAIAAAADGTRGGNVVDMRDATIARLEARLARLERTHRNVVAAACGNRAGMDMAHRAVLTLLEPADLDGLLAALAGPVANILRLEGLRLLVEAGATAPDIAEGAICVVEPGATTLFAAPAPDGAPRPVTLRRIAEGERFLYGEAAGAIRSEACLALDLGAGRAGVLVLGSAEPEQFAPGQGTDFLAFLGGAVERLLRRALP